MRNVRKILFGAVALAAMAFGATTARAKSIVLTDGAAPTLSGGQWTYTYNVFINAPDSTHTSVINSGAASPAPASSATVVAATAGDFFNLVDIAGYVPGSATASLTQLGAGVWQKLDSSNGLWPTDGTTVPDSLGVTNVSWQYVNAANTGIQNADSIFSPVGGSLSIGSVTIKSTIAPGQTNNLRYTGQDNSSVNGTDQSNQGFVTGPNAVPVPSALWAGGLLLSGLVIRRMRRVER
jgi:hypothetical protein